MEANMIVKKLKSPAPGRVWVAYREGAEDVQGLGDTDVDARLALLQTEQKLQAQSVADQANVPGPMLSDTIKAEVVRGNKPGPSEQAVDPHAGDRT